MDLLEKMATYVRVIEAGSFSAAAKKLKLTSGAVSRQVAALEAELGVTLLARSTRSMAATADGHRYYEQCLRVLREVAEAQTIGHARGTSGTLRVGAPVSFGLGVLVPRLEALRVKHPGMRVELMLEDRLVDTSLEGLDVLVRAGDAPLTTGVVARPLTSFPFVLVASRSYLRSRGTPGSPEALLSHDALSCHSAPGPDMWVLRDGKREVRVAIAPAVVFRCAILQAIRDFAIAGQGIALLPDWFVRREIEGGSLEPVLSAWRTEPRTVTAVYRRTDRESPRIRAFLDHLSAAESIRDLSA